MVSYLCFSFNCTRSRLRKHCCPLAVDHKKSLAWYRHITIDNLPGCLVFSHNPTFSDQVSFLQLYPLDYLCMRFKLYLIKAEETLLPSSCRSKKSMACRHINFVNLPCCLGFSHNPTLSDQVSFLQLYPLNYIFVLGSSCCPLAVGQKSQWLGTDIYSLVIYQVV